MVDEETLDASVRRVLEAKLRMGLFDDPYVDEERARDGARRPRAPRGGAHRRGALGGAAAQRGRPAAARRRALGSIAVIGPLADSRRDTLGPWCFDFDLDETVTVLEGIRRQAGAAAGSATRPASARRSGPSRRCSTCSAATRRRTREGFDDEAELARAVDLAHGAPTSRWSSLGEWQNMIGEAASRSSLELPGRQLELLQAVAATGTPVVLLVMNGRPLDLRWAAEHVPAILDIWYPGTQGGTAVANLLFGDVAPGGKLPFTLAAHGRPGADGLRAHASRTSPRTRAGATGTRTSTPLFPFGHGLSYAPLRVRRPARRPRRDRARRDRHRVGERHQRRRARRPTRSRSSTSTSGTARPRARCASSRASSASPSPPASRARCASRSGPAELRYWNAAARDWVIDASTFDVWVGGDSTAELIDDVRGHRGLAGSRRPACVA